ncbi:energy-coupling factor ABC transporter ATP-binding protein [Desulfolutivibrio sulfoxidireducens]|uniref:energy-coupling factor ABC transporter ATP-binding protein n=1 Tax=Desulfolutivibrio sulfoxidireducens TaxID=2773299 RepID=UPI00159E5C16|nr:energy-coupling factor ABC transporter ATP-binding protein [Desulfolutivibrio sulfoxidireducens]QLA15642.1 ATP-binding cassette domain-containing protein [Desulfolutivibrio sulfoxidireducens]QLA19248.1 ATP-binding cassette domain-containing protein [Desulfolutivibrio sulfoxidireducens]
MNSPLIVLRDVLQAHGGRTVLDVPFLAVEKGAIVGITGPNGSGKTTLLRILAFLDRPLRGEVLFAGKPASGREGELRKVVTLLVQNPYLLRRSVRANVAYGLKIRGARDLRKKTDRALAAVGLDPRIFADRSRHELSGGEAQRVALASRLAFEPKVLLLDEPTASLDGESAGLVRKAARDARDRLGATLVVVSHDIRWLREICDQMVTMENGRLTG